jgi:hypothetical protein
LTEQDIFSNTSQVLMSAPQAGAKPRRLSAKAVQSFRLMWTEAVSGIPLPSWCEPARLADFLSHETEQYYIEKRLDERYERIMKESRNMGEAFIKYAVAMEDYSKAMIVVLEDEITRKPKAFYRSDFPLSLLTKFDLLKHTQIQAYDCLWRHLDSFKAKASLYKGNSIKFNSHVTVPSNPTSKLLVDSYNTTDRAGSSLLVYMRICNVSSYEELLEDTPLSKAKLNPRTYSQLYQDFETKLYGFRNILLRLTPQTYSVPQSLSSASKMLGEILLDELPPAATES